MSKHTPGPWHTGGKLDAIVYAPDGYAVAGCQTYHGLRDEACTAANARLIAAAPELLEALDMMERHFSRYDDTHNNLVLEQARAAIAKATGETE